MRAMDMEKHCGALAKIEGTILKEAERFVTDCDEEIKVTWDIYHKGLTQQLAMEDPDYLEIKKTVSDFESEISDRMEVLIHLLEAADAVNNARHAAKWCDKIDD